MCVAAIVDELPLDDNYAYVLIVGVGYFVVGIIGGCECVYIWWYDWGYITICICFSSVILLVLLWDW